MAHKPSHEEKPDKKLQNITVIVNTQQTVHDYKAKETVGAVADQALQETNNAGDRSKWVMTLEGRELDFNKTLGDEGVQDNATLRLSLRRGVAG
jgi:hypothetical protein